MSATNESLRHLVIANAVNDGLKDAGIVAVAFALRDGETRAVVVSSIRFHACFEVAPGVDLEEAAEHILTLVRSRAEKAALEGPQVIRVGPENTIGRL